MPGSEGPSKLGSAVWMNKREVARIDFDAAHAVTRNNDGWRAGFSGDGELHVRMAGGHHDSIPVAAGDFLLASGEDFYLSRAAGGPDAPGKGAPPAKAGGPKGKA